MSYPQVMVICVECAYTLLFNAVVSGFIESKQDDKENKEDEPAKGSGKANG